MSNKQNTHMKMARFTQDRRIQPLTHHLQGVAKYSEQHAQPLFQNMSYLIGILHDLGKASDAFQDKIQNAYFDYPKADTRVNHSNAGAEYLYQIHQNTTDVHEKIALECMMHVIVSHHAGLYNIYDIEQDQPSLHMRLQTKTCTDDMIAWFHKYVLSLDAFQERLQRVYADMRILCTKGQDLMNQGLFTFTTLYLFSLCIDADRNDSQAFEEKSVRSTPQSVYSIMTTNIENFYRTLQTKTPTPLNQMRQYIADTCYQKSQQPPGVYTLSAPVGAGKTLAVMRYALHHAMRYHKERIFYLLPYMTIIEQNSQTLRDILLGDTLPNDTILEHHSNVTHAKETHHDFTQGYTKDNWHHPLIISTFYQYLAVCFSGDKQAIRRHHALARSVIILDEAQSIPPHTMKLVTQWIDFSTRFLDTTIVLCTATPPTMALTTTELMPESTQDMQVFDRVDVYDETNTRFTNSQCAQFIAKQYHKHQQVIAILNIKRAVSNTVQQLKRMHPRITVHHLSTNMCVAHRQQRIADMRDDLTHQRPFICITTPLIEAGVDISVPCIVRSITGLDNIAQASGRCNRHNERDTKGEVYIIETDFDSGTKLDKLPAIQIGGALTKQLLHHLHHQHPQDAMKHILTNDTLATYSKHYRQAIEPYSEAMVGNTAQSLYRLYTACHLQHYQNQTSPFFINTRLRDAQDHFYVYDDKTLPVCVPYGDAMTLYEQFQQGYLTQHQLQRALQPYTVQVYPHEWQHLQRASALDVLTISDTETLAFLHPDYYRDDSGIDYDKINTAT